MMKRHEYLLQLREKAERALQVDIDPNQGYKSEDFQSLIHDLRVYQIELEMQNEELFRAQVALEAARDEYLDLYNEAPVGYATLDKMGNMVRVNETLAHLLRCEVEQLVGRRLLEFVHDEDRPVLQGRFRAFFNKPQGKEVDVRLACAEEVYVAISGRRVRALRPSSQERRSDHLLIAVTDITQTKKKRIGAVAFPSSV